MRTQQRPWAAAPESTRPAWRGNLGPLATCGAALGLTLSPLAALAADVVAVPEYFTQYTVTTDQASSPITDIVMIESNGEFGDDVANSVTWSFLASGSGETTVLNNPFPSAAATTRSLLLGVVTDLPFDAPGQQHLVLMVNDAAAANMANIAWGTIFTTTFEQDILAAVSFMGSNVGVPSPERDAAVDRVFSFANNEATEAKVGFNGLPGSVWFNSVGSFSVVAFSDGTLIGTGISELVEVSAVPEPANWAMMGAGLGLLGWLQRRRRS